MPKFPDPADTDMSEGRENTALDASQEALRQSEQRFETLLKLSADSYWELDEHFRFIRFSRIENDHTDTLAAFFIGKTPLELRIPEDNATNWSNNQAILARHEPFENFEHMGYDMDGDQIWLSTSGEPIFDHENLFKGYRGTSKNITQQKISAAALKASEQRLRLVIDIAGIGIWEWDMISDQVLWDKRQFELFGHPEVEGSIPLSTTLDIIHPDDREKLSETAKMVLEEGATALNEFRVIHPDGTVRWLLGSSGVVELNDSATSAILVGVNMDITASKETEIALRKSESSLSEANQTLESRIAKRSSELELEARRHAKTLSELAVVQRLDSIGQLAGGVAHDFNNLLSVILGNLELAAPRVTDAMAREFILEAQEAVESGVGLNRRLLRFARKQDLRPVRLSAGKRVLETVRLLGRSIGEDIRISTKIDPNIWDVFADPSEIDSALINLAVNARDAMPDGGNLSIEARNYVQTREDAEATPDFPPGDYIGLFVTDTGCGMPAEVLKKAIDPFFTTKEQGKGTGLGLSSVYGFAKQSLGFLTIDSQLGEGTTISLYLPRASEPTGPKEKPTLMGDLPKSYGELILVVEDDPKVRKISVKRLEHLGYIVLEASGGQGAIDILKDGSPVKLVLSDVVMPGGITGYQLAQWTTTHRPDVKILLTSGYNDPAKRTGNQVANDDVAFLGKPHSLHQLARSIRDALGTE
jgi:PAS domain S-box-containing protein